MTFLNILIIIIFSADFEKAFDSVDHTVLFVTLKKFGLADISINWRSSSR